MRILFSALCVIFGASVVQAAPTGAPQPVPAPLQRAYIPGGFDSNDVVQIVVEGMFPSSCYRPGFIGARVNQAARRIEVNAGAFLYSGVCLDFVVPFDQVINLGILEPGRYDVVQAAGARTRGGVLGSFEIRTATASEPDDFTYAPISQAMFQQGAGGSQVLLAGEFPLSCMSLEDVKVTVEKTSIVVQPIVKMDKTRPCIRGRYAFTQNIPVRGVPAGRYVLHVRSMNAKAINSLVDVR